MQPTGNVRWNKDHTNWKVVSMFPQLVHINLLQTAELRQPRRPWSYPAHSGFTQHYANTADIAAWSVKSRLRSYKLSQNDNRRGLFRINCVLQFVLWTVSNVDQQVHKHWESLPFSLRVHTRTHTHTHTNAKPKGESHRPVNLLKSPQIIIRYSDHSQWDLTHMAKVGI